MTNSASSSKSDASASGLRSFHARANSAGIASGDRLRRGRQLLAGPAAVEADELGAVVVQDVGGDDAQDAAFGQHHDHVAAGAHILDVVRQMLELLEVEGPDQRALELRQEAVLDAGRIETMEILLAVQDVDVLAIESGLEQRVDRRSRLDRVADGPDDAIRRVANEIGTVSARLFSWRRPWWTVGEATARWTR